MVLDGSWGVLLQRKLRSEEDYRGDAFRDHSSDVSGDPDLLNLTQPEVVLDLHRRVLRRRRRHRDHEHVHCELDRAGRLRARGARLRDERRRRAARRQAADEVGGFVAGAIGPLNVTLSHVARGRRRRLPRRHLRPGARGLRGADRRPRGRWGRPAPDRDDLRHAERQGGDRRRPRRRAGDPAAGSRSRPSTPRPQPLRTDRGGVLDLGRARGAADRRRELLARSRQMRPYVENLSRVAQTFVSATRTPACRTSSACTTSMPADTSRWLGEFARDGLVNLVGGCCGTTPEHIRAIRARSTVRPRGACRREAGTALLGAGAVQIGPDTGFVMIGERTNVTGSARFRRLIEAGDLQGAVESRSSRCRAGRTSST